ncbi:hypothetical protein SLEP1_g38484 [Rubroshorea leprosula]|nr:hypothetical protein SLEP1_g38484 [Rubroshorea leprosula]
MNSPAREDDKPGEVFLDKSNIMHEVTVDEEDRPDVEDEEHSDSENMGANDLPDVDHEEHSDSENMGADVMAGGIDEALHDRINRNIRDHVIVDFSDTSIFKVPNHLRKINAKAYEPLVISIGPYHHGKEHLQAMQLQKMNYLKLALHYTPENSLEKYVTALKEMEKQIRGFYSENLDRIGGEDLVEMMLLDGFFIIGLISRGRHGLTDFYWRNVMRDLLLVENQLPFSVLLKLYSMHVVQDGRLERDPSDMIVQNVITYFDRMVPGLPIIPIYARLCHQGIFDSEDGLPIIRRAGYLEATHMLALLHDNVTRTRQRLPSSATASFPRASSPQFPRWLSCLASASSPQFPRWLPCLAPPRKPPSRRLIPCSASLDPVMPEERKWRFIRSATELNEAGIKFQKKEGKLFDIEFQKEVMSIPTLMIDDYTESIFRNFVAYEQLHGLYSAKPFTDYITFMDCLINTGKDVELLCRCGVLDNWLGDHEVVATMFNRLRDSVLVSEGDFFYSNIFTRVNEHCNRKWNLWKANLWHNYFNTPWALISFIAAVFLLLFAMLQTLFSILSYRH